MAKCSGGRAWTWAWRPTQQFESGIKSQTRTANEHKSGITWNTFPLWYFHNPFYPEYPPTTVTGPLYQAWYQLDGERGEEPPDLRQQPFFTFVEPPGIYHLFTNCLGNVVTGSVYHHGSWTSHKLPYVKEGCEMN